MASVLAALTAIAAVLAASPAAAAAAGAACDGGRCAAGGADAVGMLQVHGLEESGALGDGPIDLSVPARRMARGWQDWYTGLTSGNFPLAEKTDEDPRMCQVGNKGKYFYIGGLVKLDVEVPDDDSNWLQRRAQRLLHLPPNRQRRSAPELNVDRECEVPRGVQYIVTPIINGWSHLCSGPEVSTKEGLWKDVHAFGKIVEERTRFRVYLDGELVLDKQGPQDTQDASKAFFNPESAKDISRNGPPRCSDLAPGVPDGSVCDKTCNPFWKLPGAMAGYFVAIPVPAWRTKAPKTLYYEMNFPGFNLYVRYNFTYGHKR